jgi:hypothetical protein
LLVLQQNHIRGFSEGGRGILHAGDLAAIENNVEGVKFTVPYVFPSILDRENNVMNGMKVGVFSVQGITPELYLVSPQIVGRRSFDKSVR